MIDREIQSRMDAYRGNPQALAQKYSQNQELIDLLALQKLKSEKESAARDIQLKMGLGQMPTVADQREQEVMDMTKQEVAQQSAEVMQNKMRQRQDAIKQITENPQMAGIASVPAPNIAPKMMAGGGIVAFDEGGDVQQESLMQMAQRGIRTLLGKSPEDVYARRKAEAAAEADYSPEERAARQRQVADRAAYDARYFNPEVERDRAITRGLLSAAGGTTPGATIARMGVGIEGAREAAEIANRQRLLDRQKQEMDLIDVGPASRMAGLKYGSQAENYATQGLHHGTDAATRLIQTLEAAANRAGGADDKKIAQAYQALNNNPEIRELLKTRERSTLPIDAPENQIINRRIYEIAVPIFRGRNLDPDLFIPKPPEVTEPAPKPSRIEQLQGIVQGALGLNPSTAPVGRVIDFSQVQRRN